MGPGIAERLLDDRHRDRLTALARTDPHLIAHDLTAPSPPSRPRSPRPKYC